MKQLTLTPSLLLKLNRLRKPPVSLSYSGKDILELNSRPIIAVVGTRKPTPTGMYATRTLISELTGTDCIVISGLALGIDALAHETALAHGIHTIAVLPSGLRNITPATNEPLAGRIIQNDGMIISEYEPDHSPRKAEFLQRNRLIAALSDIVIIPEAAARSGSLNTALHAHRMNIPVGVVPGSIQNPMSTGTNGLLKSYGHAVTCGEDIVRLLGLQKISIVKKPDYQPQNDQEAAVLHSLQNGTSSLDILLAETSLSISTLQSTLTLLEIRGIVRCDSAGQWHTV